MNKMKGNNASEYEADVDSNNAERGGENDVGKGMSFGIKKERRKKGINERRKGCQQQG
jgi:hypothetical protein